MDFQEVGNLDRIKNISLNVRNWKDLQDSIRADMDYL